MPPAPARPPAPLLLLTRPLAESLRLARLLAPGTPPEGPDPATDRAHGPDFCPDLGPDLGPDIGCDPEADAEQDPVPGRDPAPNPKGDPTADAGFDAPPDRSSARPPGAVHASDASDALASDASDASDAPAPDPPAPDASTPDASAPGAVIVSPLLRIVPVDHDPAPLRAAAGLVFTSAHAVAAAGPGGGRPALCVGARTGQAARRAGFAVTLGAGGAAGLLPLIAAHGPGLIHPHGRHLAQRLPVPGVVVYDQRPLPLTARARAALAGGRAVVLPVYSPRSAALLAACATGARAALHVAAISPAAARAWCAHGPTPARMTLAQAPSGAAMVAAIRRALAAEQS